MEVVQVKYSNNKSGTYVEYRLKMNTRSLEELNAYDQFLQKSIRKEFEPLFKVHGMDFATEKSYVVCEGEDMYLVICLQGATTPQLEQCLVGMGIGKSGGES